MRIGSAMTYLIILHIITFGHNIEYWKMLFYCRWKVISAERFLRSSMSTEVFSDKNKKDLHIKSGFYFPSQHFGSYFFFRNTLLLLLSCSNVKLAGWSLKEEFDNRLLDTVHHSGSLLASQLLQHPCLWLCQIQSFAPLWGFITKSHFTNFRAGNFAWKAKSFNYDVKTTKCEIQFRHSIYCKCPIHHSRADCQIHCQISLK